MGCMKVSDRCAVRILTMLAEHNLKSKACLAREVVQAVVAYDVIVRLPQLVKFGDKHVQRGRGPFLRAPAVNNVTYRAPAAI